MSATITQYNNIQCEICYRWVHASCEGIPKEKYKLFNQVIGEIPNLVYC